MATLNSQKLLVNDPFPKVVQCREAASQTFLAGQPVADNGSGEVKLWTAALAKPIKGIAAADASGVTDATIQVFPLTEGMELELTYCTRAGVRAATAATLQGQRVGLVAIGSTGYYGAALTLNGFPQSIGVIDRLSPKDTVGDTGARVIVSVTPSLLGLE